MNPHQTHMTRTSGGTAGRIGPAAARLTAFGVSLLAVINVAQAQNAPQRVVSINLCTDQMAMQIAAPGQLLSVSYIAADPVSSALADQASAYRLNHGLAEEIYLMQPDLVLAGTYSARTTVDLLRQLGVRVEQFAPESSLEDVRANLVRMGEILDQPARAAELVAKFDAELAQASQAPHTKVTAATYEANSYTAGSGTLVDAAISAAGLKNLGAELGYVGSTRLPLENLILAKPDLLIGGGREYQAPALADGNFDHPAFLALARRSQPVYLPARYTICGGLATAQAVRILSDAARAAEAKRLPVSEAKDQ